MMESGQSALSVSRHFNVGKTQVQELRTKRKAEVLDKFESNANPNSKRQRKTGNEDINDVVWIWFQDANTRGFPVGGPAIQHKARMVANQLGKSTFKASNGWLSSFLKRNNIAFKSYSGERADVSTVVVADWKQRVPEIIKEYAARDVYNMDETGLFYRDTTKSTYFVKGEDCAGGKRSKERITLALCANLAGK